MLRPLLPQEGGWNTEAGQIEAAQMTCRVGCDTHWLDAAWFERGFPMA
jgi:hypothetical protein